MAKVINCSNVRLIVSVGSEKEKYPLTHSQTAGNLTFSQENLGRSLDTHLHRFMKMTEIADIKVRSHFPARKLILLRRRIIRPLTESFGHYYIGIS